MEYTHDYYEVLGIETNSDKQEIKKAYKKQALKYHPDRNKSSKSEKEFKLIKEAYDTLSDDEKRQEYDIIRNIEIKKRNANLPKKYGSDTAVKTYTKKNVPKKTSSEELYYDDENDLLTTIIGGLTSSSRKGRGRRSGSNLMRSKGGLASTLLNSTGHHKKRQHRRGRRF